MSSERPLPFRVEVSPAAPEQEPVLANLLELYVHDLSEFFDVELQPNGRFGYPSLSRYWQEPGRFPFLVKVDGQLAGFALVCRGSRINDDPRIWDMAEFFIMRGYRRRGIGAALAQEVWRHFPGKWEVRVRESNTTALAFWEAAIKAFTSANAVPVSVEVGGAHRRVFAFTSSGEA